MPSIHVSTLEDLPGLAECHSSAFPEALSTRLGHTATKKMLEWYIVSDRGVLFHLAEDGDLIAYCGGIRIHEPGRHGAFTSISQYAYWHFVRAYLRRPRLLFSRENRAKYMSIFRNVLIRLRLRRPDVRVSGEMRAKFRPSWGLVVIGVHPDHRYRGHGSRLIAHFEKLAREDGVDIVRVSVKADNIPAIRAYQGSGWRVSRHTGDSLQMQKRL